MYDILIRGGTVVDGSGAPPFTADICVRNGVIAEIGRIASAAERTINADGALVTPGWVDAHTHYDGQVTWDDRLEGSAANGVTTVVMGNCGDGFAPVPPGGAHRPDGRCGRHSRYCAVRRHALGRLGNLS